MTVAERTTVVFGGSAGIGLAIAERCAQDGDRIVLLARNEERLRQASALVTRAGARDVRYLQADLADSDGLARTLVDLATLAPAPQRLVLNGGDRKSTRLNSSHVSESRMPSSA